MARVLSLSKLGETDDHHMVSGRRRKKKTPPHTFYFHRYLVVWLRVKEKQCSSDPRNISHTEELAEERKFS